MKTNLFSISGTLSDKEYLKLLAIIFLELFIVTIVLLFIMDIQNAEVAGASVMNQVVAVTMFGLLLANLIIFNFALLGAVVRRSRDTGHTVLWGALTILIPVPMLLVLAFIPGHKA